MATISLRVLSNGPLSRLAAVLALYRPHVDEIVAVVNGLFRPLELRQLWPVCDEVVPVEMTGDFTAGRYRPWLLRTANADWVSLIDHDEVPATSLLGGLAAAAALDHVAQICGPRRWLYPDEATYLDRTPWEPNMKQLLIRTTPTTTCLRAGVHRDSPIVAPYRHTEMASYHLVLLENRELRVRRVAHYGRLGRAQQPPPAGFTDRDYYLPEDHPRPLELAPVPAGDVALIRSVAARTDAADPVIDRMTRPGDGREWLPGTLRMAQIESFWPGQPFQPDHARAELRIWGGAGGQVPGRIAPGSDLVVWVSMRNTSPRSWPREGGDPPVRLGAYWIGATGQVKAGEFRALLGGEVRPGEQAIEPILVTAPQTPGNYQLTLDMVVEDVRWFGCGLTVPVAVGPPAAGS